MRLLTQSEQSIRRIVRNDALPGACGWRIDTEAVKRLDSRNALR